MRSEFADHLVGPVELLHKFSAFKVLVCTFPSHEGSEHGLHVVVSEQSNRKFLTSHVVA